MATSPAKIEAVELKSTLLDEALRQVATLSRGRQDTIARRILDELVTPQDPQAARFQSLVEAKYTSGLTAAESAEFAALEAGFQKADEKFYRPILERVRREVTAGRSRPVKKMQKPFKQA